MALLTGKAMYATFMLIWPQIITSEQRQGLIPTRTLSLHVTALLPPVPDVSAWALYSKHWGIKESFNHPPKWMSVQKGRVKRDTREVLFEGGAGTTGSRRGKS